MFREKIELAFECQAPVQVPIKAASEGGVVGSTQVGVCKPHGGKLRAKFKACVVVLGKRRQSAKQREQPEESKIAGNQTKHEAALPLRQARAAESSISYLRITGFSAGTPDFLGAIIRPRDGWRDTRHTRRDTGPHPCAASSMAWKGESWLARRRECEFSFPSTSNFPGRAFCAAARSQWRSRSATHRRANSRHHRRA